MSANSDVNSKGWTTTGHIIVRLFAAAVVLGITAFFTPGFSISGILPLAVAAVVLTILDYFLTKVTGINASPFARGFSGFVAAAVIIYATQFFVSGYSVTIFGALIGAVIFGIIDYLIPGDAM